MHGTEYCFECVVRGLSVIYGSGGCGHTQPTSLMLTMFGLLQRNDDDDGEDDDDDDDDDDVSSKSS